MDLPETYPLSPPDLIKTVVTVAHFDLMQLKAIVESRPHLVKASWDWGFGDWETPLGAACHMGRRDIAEYLIARGVPPTLFSSILFGDLAIVQQTLESNPGLATVAGPHSISLLAHARMAGKSGQQVLSYLRMRGDADLPKPAGLSDRERSLICGSYRFVEDSLALVNVTDDVKDYQGNPMYTEPPQLNWARPNATARPLFHTGNLKFYPAGVPSTEIGFEKLEKDVVMNIVDGPERRRFSKASG